MAQQATTLIDLPFPISDIDYTDCFESKPLYKTSPSLRDMVYYFIANWPGWVNALLAIRTFIVYPFGLKAGSLIDSLKPPKHIFVWENNGMVEVFTIVHLSENKVVLYINDKHLNAYLTFERNIHLQQTSMKVQTDVHFHNSLGWWYFSLIKPFHKIIVKNQINNTIKFFSHV